MAENYSKSKLRRKKSSVADYQPEISSRETPRKSPPTLTSAEFTAETEGSVVPAAVWWNREQLPAVETLYALMMKSALLHLENQHWDVVPDLPDPSTAIPPPPQLDKQQWCNLSEDVAPFPEPNPPSPKSPPRPDPLSLNSTQQTRPVVDTSDRLLSSYSGQKHDGKMMPIQALTKICWPPLHNWQSESSLAGPTSVGGEEGRKVQKHEKEEKEKRETVCINRRPLTNQVKVFNSRAPLQKEGKNKEEVMEDEEEEEEDVQRSGRRDGGVAGRLQTCPMCLRMFPAGFTQMDCDSHLAQCLSEMNVDMTW